MRDALATAMKQGKDMPATTTVPEPEGSPALGPSDSPAFPTGTPPLPVSCLPDIPFVGTPPVGNPFAEFIAGPTQKKGDHSSSSSSSNHCDKRTHVDSQEIKARSEQSSAQGNEDMPKLVLEAGPSFGQWGQEPARPPSSPTRATTDPDDGTAGGSSRSTGDQASSDSDLSRENVVDSDMDTASSDCITCSDTDEVTVPTARKKYWKRVQASCSLSKGSLWTEAKLKRISNSHWAMWGHDHESVNTEWECALAEDCNSFEMQKMMVKTDQLLTIAKAAGSKIYTRLRGWSPWPGKNSGIVSETIPHSLLSFLWKGND